MRGIWAERREEGFIVISDQLSVIIQQSGFVEA